MKKQVVFHWSDDCKEAFLTLKQKLSEPLVLVYPKFDPHISWRKMQALRKQVKRINFQDPGMNHIRSSDERTDPNVMVLKVYFLEKSKSINLG